MKKNPMYSMVFLLVILAACGFLTNCKGDDGEAYLAYSWVYAPQYLYDENSAIPGTVYNGTYYNTDDGSYYMEYIAWDGSGWWMNYDISSNPGKIFFQEGDPAYFEICLYSSGPSLYEWDEAKSADDIITSDLESNTSGLVEGSGAPERYAEPSAPAGRSNSGTETIIRGGYTLTIEWGRME